MAEGGLTKRGLVTGVGCWLLALTVWSGQSAAAPAMPTQTFTVQVARGLSTPWLGRSEQAIERQSRAVRSRWGTPLIRFGPRGWRVYIRRGYHSNNPPGWHSLRSGRPYALVEIGTWAPAAGVFDHEILETLVDPYDHRLVGGRLAEICDSVMGHRYRASNGALLVDWVYPQYFRAATTGPWDQLRVLSGGAP